jgi:hypothetical protein
VPVGVDSAGTEALGYGFEPIDSVIEKGGAR